MMLSLCTCIYFLASSLISDRVCKVYGDRAKTNFSFEYKTFLGELYDDYNISTKSTKSDIANLYGRLNISNTPWFDLDTSSCYHKQDLTSKKRCCRCDQYCIKTGQCCFDKFFELYNGSGMNKQSKCMHIISCIIIRCIRISASKYIK